LLSVFARFFGRRGPQSEAPAAPPVQDDHSTDSAEPQPTIQTESVRPTEAAGGREAIAGPIEPTPPEVPRAASTVAEGAQPAVPRFRAVEDVDGWYVEDHESGWTANVYGYRLERLRESRAKSLAEMLNRSRHFNSGST
jgi:hypothetical protein